jgi:hypothetical protein
MARLRDYLSRNQRSDAMGCYHGQDDYAGQDGAVAADGLEVHGDVEKVCPVDDAVQGALEED